MLSNNEKVGKIGLLNFMKSRNACMGILTIVFASVFVDFYGGILSV